MKKEINTALCSGGVIKSNNPVLLAIIMQTISVFEWIGIYLHLIDNCSELPKIDAFSCIFSSNEFLPTVQEGMRYHTENQCSYTT